jgi:hypothetical protein
MRVLRSPLSMTSPIPGNNRRSRATRRIDYPVQCAWYRARVTTSACVRDFLESLDGYAQAAIEAFPASHRIPSSA